MNLFDRVKINIYHLEDEELYEHMICYNNKSGTIIGIHYSRLVSYIRNGACYTSEYIIQFDNPADDDNMACVLPEQCLELL